MIFCHQDNLMSLPSEVSHIGLLIFFKKLLLKCFLFYIFLSCLMNFVYFKLQDVAVKFLTVQDFFDDQLKEFLREVCTSLLDHMCTEIPPLAPLMKLFICNVFRLQ